MLISNREIIKWLGFSTFEVFIQLTALLVFTILLALKVENVINYSWWSIFIPMFAGDGAVLYFSTIVFIRTIHAENNKEAYKRALLISLILACLFLFKMLLCQLLEGNITTPASLVMAPLFVLYVVYLIRACKVT